MPLFVSSAGQHSPEDFFGSLQTGVLLCQLLQIQDEAGSSRARSRVANWIVGIQANTALSDYCVGRSRASRMLQVSAFGREIEKNRIESSGKKSLAMEIILLLPDLRLGRTVRGDKNRK